MLTVSRQTDAPMKNSTKATTIGIDLGDKTHKTCTLNADGAIVERATVLNNREALLGFSPANIGAAMIMEAGTQITKAGNSMLRRLLISCAQDTLSWHGPPSVLRAAGERRMAKGTKVAKKKAVVAVGRKLAVTMLGLWKKPEGVYRPFPNQPESELAA